MGEKRTRFAGSSGPLENGVLLRCSADGERRLEGAERYAKSVRGEVQAGRDERRARWSDWQATLVDIDNYTGGCVAPEQRVRRIPWRSSSALVRRTWATSSSTIDRSCGFTGCVTSTAAINARCSSAASTTTPSMSLDRMPVSISWARNCVCSSRPVSGIPSLHQREGATDARVEFCWNEAVLGHDPVDGEGAEESESVTQ